MSSVLCQHFSDLGPSSRSSWSPCAGSKCSYIPDFEGQQLVCLILKSFCCTFLRRSGIFQIARYDAVHKISPGLLVCCFRESCRTDDFVLLTRTPVKASSNMLNTDSLHIFGLVIKVDNHDEVRGQRVATINVNLLTRSATGVTISSGCAFVGGHLPASN